MQTVSRHPKRWLLMLISATIQMVPISVDATPESRAAAPFLMFSPSTRANGMGGIGVALLDEPGGYYNPATPALIARKHFFSTVNYTSRFKIVPNLADDIYSTYNAFQIGWNSNQWPIRNQGGEQEKSLSIAFAYYRIKHSLGFQHRTDQQGQDLGTFESFGRASNFGFGIAGHWWVDLAFGLTHKNITDNLAGAGLERGKGESNGTAKDFGFALRLPLFKLFERLRIPQERRRIHWRPHIDLQAGAAWFNRGDDLVIINTDQADPLPQYRRIGWLSVVGLSWVPHGVPLEMVRLAGGTETYTPMVGGEVEPGTSDSMWGLEISFFDVVDIRWGHIDDGDGNRHLDTTGTTIRSDGLFKFAQILVSRTGQQNPVLDFISEHLSISWTRFVAKGGPGFRNNSHTQIALTF